MNKFYTNFKLDTIRHSQQSFVYKKILHIPLQHRQTQKLEAIKIQSVACWTRQRVNQTHLSKQLIMNFLTWQSVHKNVHTHT